MKKPSEFIKLLTQGGNNFYINSSHIVGVFPVATGTTCVEYNVGNTQQKCYCKDTVEQVGYLINNKAQEWEDFYDEKYKEEEK